jgi:hypothetical protein
MFIIRAKINWLPKKLYHVNGMVFFLHSATPMLIQKAELIALLMDIFNLFEHIGLAARAFKSNKLDKKRCRLFLCVIHLTTCFRYGHVSFAKCIRHIK